MPFCHGRLVQHDFFCGLHRTFLPARVGIFFALLVARVVPVAFVQYGNALIVLLDAANNLFVNLFLEPFCGGHGLFGVGILRLQVIHHLGGLRVRLLGGFLLVAQAHPEVIVLQLQSMDVCGVGLLCGVRSRREFRRFGHIFRSLHVRGGGVAAQSQGPGGRQGHAKKSCVHFNRCCGPATCEAPQR